MFRAYLRAIAAVAVGVLLSGLGVTQIELQEYYQTVVPENVQGHVPLERFAETATGLLGYDPSAPLYVRYGQHVTTYLGSELVVYTVGGLTAATVAILVVDRARS